MCSWKNGRMPDEWTGAVTLPLHKGKDGKDDCKHYIGQLIGHNRQGVWEKCY